MTAKIRISIIITIYIVLISLTVLVGCGAQSTNEEPKQSELSKVAVKEDTASESTDIVPEKETTPETRTAEEQIDAPDICGFLPQSITADVTYERESVNDEWVKTDVVYKKWDANLKKLGGTVWKMDNGDSVIYIRLRDTIEFMQAKIVPKSDGTDVLQFSTTILGAMATDANDSDGNIELTRIHVLSGEVSDSGELVLTMDIDGGSESMTLSDFTKIEKKDLPFSEEEYKAVADAR